ncbi:meiosis inhibitor protein 1-like [Cyclopterus lumpus]|uniref:meiosis inhibitor protein 1-like n=1 Tax=Cyclopterus lumpus TaxID=8103 RepID=UPI0014861228|nr:meiosis inhibitor protein 1-like [Cyclopterus lumpus]
MSEITRGDIVCDKLHFRHDPKWSGRLGPADGSGPLLCVACVVEMIDSEEIASVRKYFALSSISGVLRGSPGALRELLRQDDRASQQFMTSLLGMLHTVEDQATLEKVDQVLVQLLLEFQSELSYRFVLDEIHKQLSDQLSVKGFLPTFKFLGNLVEAVPNVAYNLVTKYVPLLERLCSALFYPDEALKASVLYVWLKLFGTAGGLAAQSLPTAIRDRVCILLLQTLANANSPQLIKNCVGLLLLLLQLRGAVSVLMNSNTDQIMCHENQNIHTDKGQVLSQDQEQQCSLPLMLKKLLMSGDEMLQATSARCIASVLVQSQLVQSQCSAPFINADVPEFLFDRLASSQSEMLLFSVYSCLILLTQDPLFFSQCHSVYGIDSIVRSLKEALQLPNYEVPKQGLLLLTELLERQPPSERLFPSGSGFEAVSEAVLGGVSSPCLLVATQAANAASALFRLNHQSRPVQYGKIEGLIEAITNRYSELPFPSPAHHRSSMSLKKSDPNSQVSRSEGFLLQSLVCFQAACRLAEECSSEPVLKENTFTAPSKNSHAQDSLKSFCECLLHCCDSVWIPTVIGICEHAPNAQILQHFYSILSSQFTLLPSLMPVFANKLASTGFYRLPLEHKRLFCAGNRHPYLNTCCCGFLQKLSICMLYQSDPASVSCLHDVEEVENLLLYNLPSLSCHLSNWPTLLCESPGLQLCEYKGPRATQYCLVILLHLTLQQGDRLLPDQTVFSSVMWLLHSVQAQGSCALPRAVLRSALYLLARTQDKSPDLDGASLNCISKALTSHQSFPSLSIHHPALLHFIWRYPDLAEKYGPLVLELWLTKQAQHSDAEQNVHAAIQEKGESNTDERQDQEQDKETMELLTLTEKFPSVILTLLDMVCTREATLAGRALAVLEVFIRGQRDYEADLCADLRPAVLQALQRLSVENMGHGLGKGPTAQVNSLPLVLKLLCAMQASDPPSSSNYSKMDGVHFKLLYHVSNIAGRLKSTDTGSLLPALSYLYCCLSLSPPHCTDRAVSVLLSNTGLMDQLQTVSSSSSAPSLSPSACPPSALLCCCHLLLSSLITLQRVHSAQVQKSISWSLNTAVQRLLVQKRNTDNLLLVSYLRLLQALLDADLASAVVCLSTGPGLVGSRPLGVEDGALYPLGSRGVQCLSTALNGLLLQKHELLLRASINCLSSLLGFLQRKSPITETFVACEPWSRFLVYCLLSSGENTRLHPATLRLITILLKHGSTSVRWEPDLLQVMETVERRGREVLSEEAALALRLLLSQIQNSALQPQLSREQDRRVRAMIETLGPQAPSEGCSPSQPSNVLRVGDLSICLSDFTA